MEGSIFLKSEMKSHFSKKCAPDSTQDKETATFSNGFGSVQVENVDQPGVTEETLASRLIVACDMIDQRLDLKGEIEDVAEDLTPAPEDIQSGAAEPLPQEDIILPLEEYFDGKDFMVTPGCFTFSDWTYSNPPGKDTADLLTGETDIEGLTIERAIQETFVLLKENYQNIEDALPDTTDSEDAAIEPSADEPSAEEKRIVPQEADPETDESLAAIAKAETLAVEPESEALDNDDTLENPKMEDDMLNSQKSFERVQQAEPLSRIDRLDIILADLKSLSGAIEACAVVSEDGLIMASNLPTGLEEDSVAAMSAVMLSMGERTAAELDRGTADLLFIRGDAGYVVTTRAGADAVLVVTARLEAKLGLIFLDLNRAAKSIAETLV